MDNKTSLGAGNVAYETGNNSPVNMGRNLQQGSMNGVPKKRSKFSQKQKVVFAAFVALLAIVVIIIVVVLTSKTASDIVTPDGKDKKPQKDRSISGDDIAYGRFKAKSFALNWIADDLYSSVIDGAYHSVNVTNGEKKLILTKEENRNYSLAKLFSADQKFFLVGQNYRRIYRHSYYAEYFVKDLQTSVIRPIETPDGDKTEQIVYCTWSETNNSLVYVYKNNIYFQEDASFDEPVRQLTFDGMDGMVFNGIPDWVYEEEILATRFALTVSPDGKHLAYGKFNATDVPFFSFPKYGDPSSAYTGSTRIAYPKAGVANPKVFLKVVDLDSVKSGNASSHNSSSHRDLLPPEELTSSDFYYSKMVWNKEQVYVKWMNRHQNHSITLLYDITDPAFNGTGNQIHYEKTPGGWLDGTYPTPKFSKDGDFYFTLLEHNDWKHIAKISTKNVGDPVFLTSGSYWVDYIYCYDQQRNIIYYRSTKTAPRQKHIYSFDLNSKKEECLTCHSNLTVSSSTCGYASASFSHSCTWTVLKCLGPQVPSYALYNTKTKALEMKENNELLRNKTKQYDMPVRRYYTVPSDGYDIAVRETRPSNFDEKKKYAVIFYVYGGPNQQMVREDFALSVGDFLASKYDVIYIKLDARGSNSYGFKFMYSVYRKLGINEATDTIKVAKYLKTKPYIDSSKIAIWGWSYGGYLSSMVLGFPNQTEFSTAIAVAPVSDWRYYDTVYTERYMGMPTEQDNLEGYEVSSVLPKAKNFAGKNYLLIHGTADDNVHFQHAAQLSKELIDNDVKFRQQYYPDKDHSIRTTHIWKLINDYLVAHLTSPDT